MMPPHPTPKIFSTLIIAIQIVGCANVSPTYQLPKPPAQISRPAPQVQFVIPADGAVITRYNRERSKGIDIAGVRGAAIVAAADGQVVYVGDQLRGYGRMIILKHDATYLTAYAHNQAILVSEKDMVQQGQKIAEMGDTDSDQVKLHFELRKNGVAVDPEPYLNQALRKTGQP